MNNENFQETMIGDLINEPFTEENIDQKFGRALIFLTFGIYEILYEDDLDKVMVKAKALDDLNKAIDQVRKMTAEEIIDDLVTEPFTEENISLKMVEVFLILQNGILELISDLKKNS
ncbi:hypothetical protein SUSAZ_09255 [Sulfolobus acidocaldarius SUSAZ]|nr:hypothetical protein SUSAZ_09255 [Sulfolobus acidocaldarius SUSAZ]